MNPAGGHRQNLRAVGGSRLRLPAATPYSVQPAGQELQPPKRGPAQGAWADGGARPPLRGGGPAGRQASCPAAGNLPGGVRHVGPAVDALPPRRGPRLLHYLGRRFHAVVPAGRAGHVTAGVSADTTAGIVAPTIAGVATVGRVACEMAIVRFPTAVAVAATTRRKQAKHPRQRTARGSGGTARRIADRHRGGTTCRLTRRRTRRAARGSGHRATILRLARRSGAKHTLQQPAAGAAGQHAAHQPQKDDSSGHLRFPICKSKKHKRQRCHRQRVCRCPAVIQGRHRRSASLIGQIIGRIERILEIARVFLEASLAADPLPPRCAAGGSRIAPWGPQLAAKLQDPGSVPGKHNKTTTPIRR